MKKLLSILIGVLFLGVLAFAVNYTSSGTVGDPGTVTRIGTTESWYLKNAIYTNEAYRANKVYFDILYTVGDETSWAFTIGYLYGDSAPAVANISYFPESDSSGQFTIMSRTMLKSTGTRRYTVSVEVPDRATYIVITLANTGGTPTGNVVVKGYSNQFN